ncbi:restriction endonuclease subunit S [Tetzosporium hominis]|nr:restriction endonuclease subunit S [Tetzosporium hominis]
MENKQKPVIRFDGFLEDWKYYNFKDKVNMFNNLRVPVTASERKKGKVPYYGANGIQDFVEGFTHQGEFVLIAEDGANNIYNYPVQYVNGDIWVNNHAHVVRGKINEIDNLFLTFRMKSMNISSFLVGGGRAKLNAEVLKKIRLVIPKLDEQIIIGIFFNQIEKAINLHQQELDTLKQTKQGFLQKMFPKKGETVPEVRFAEFQGDWIGLSLNEMSSSFEYGLNASAKKYDGQNKYIRITDIDESSHKFSTDTLTSPNTDLTLANNYILNEGDILFARTGASVGKTYIYNNKDGRVYYAGFLIRARIKEEFDAEFIFQNTLTTKYKEFIKVTSQRSGQPGVNAQEYSKFTLLVPDLEEQKKIGEFFKKLDETIELHEKELASLKETKKAFLQKMFV